MKLTKEIAEKIFEAGGDWRMDCANLTRGIMSKMKWADSVDFEELWKELENESD